MKQSETNFAMTEQMRDALDELARGHMLDGLRAWVEGRDGRPSYQAAAECWRQAGDQLRAGLAARRAVRG